MVDGYIQEYNIKNLNEKEKEIELIKNIITTRKAIKNIDKNFEYAQDELVDYYIYQQKANQAKLNYLIKTAKLQGITVDMINDIRYSNLIEEDAG
ncbi:MAG: DUF2508 family protein [Clostridia bacterium]